MTTWKALLPENTPLSPTMPANFHFTIREYSHNIHLAELDRTASSEHRRIDIEEVVPPYSNPSYPNHRRLLSILRLPPLNSLWQTFVFCRFYFHRQKVNYASFSGILRAEQPLQACTLWTTESLGTPEDRHAQAAKIRPGQ